MNIKLEDSTTMLLRSNVFVMRWAVYPCVTSAEYSDLLNNEELN